MEWLGGREKVRLKYRLCRRRSKISGLTRDGVAPPFWSLSSMALPLFRLYSSPDPLRLRHPIVLFLLPCPAQPSLSQNCLGHPWDCRLPRTLVRFRDCVGCASTAELQVHCRVLALGLTGPLVAAGCRWVVVGQLLWVGRCGLVAFVSCCGLVAVGRLLYRLVTSYQASLVGR